LDVYIPQESEAAEAGSDFEEDYTNLQTFIRIFSTVMGVLLVIYIVVSLFSKHGRKQLLAALAVFALLALMMLYFANTFQPFDLPEEQARPEAVEGEPEEPGEDTRTPIEFEPQPRPWLLTAVIIAGAVVLAGGVFFALNRFSQTKSSGLSQFDGIADRARAALDEIEAAELAFDDIIIRCYAEMSLALKEERDIQRSREMTSFEFEQELVRAGFPARPVRELTRLFEQVRYGHQESGGEEKQVAVQSLNEIIEFCKEPG
jgi:hypothetical protein